jgi:hypothetical protein
MRMRWMLGLLLAGLIGTGLTSGVQAQESAESFRPTLLLRMKGLDDLISDFRLLAKQIGREDDAKKVEAALQSQTGPKGLEGVDTRKPIGLYALPEAKLDQSRVVLLLPIADEKRFLTFLESINFKAEKDDSGLYTVRVETLPFPILFRFAGGYLYGTVQFSDAVKLPADGLPAADKVLGRGSELLSLTLHIDQIPLQFRKIAISAMALQIGQAKEEDLPGGTDKQKALRDAILDELTVQLRSLIEDGTTTRLRLDLNRKTQELSVTFDLESKSGSILAKNLASLGSGQSAARAMMPNRAVMTTTLHLNVPERIRKALVPVYEELRDQGLQSLDANARDILLPLIGTLEPTIRSGQLDLALAVGGPGKGGKFTLLGAIGVEKGLAIEKSIKDILEKVPEAAGAVKTDVFQVGKINVHRLENSNPDANARELFGEDPFHLAIREDAVVLSYGEEGEPLIRQAAAGRPTAAQPLRAELSVARLARFIAREEKQAPAVAKKAFQGKGDDRIVLEVRSGNRLEVHLSVKLPVLTFAGLMDQARKKD